MVENSELRRPEERGMNVYKFLQICMFVCVCIYIFMCISFYFDNVIGMKRYGHWKGISQCDCIMFVMILMGYIPFYLSDIKDYTSTYFLSTRIKLVNSCQTSGHQWYKLKKTHMCLPKWIGWDGRAHTSLKYVSSSNIINGENSPRESLTPGGPTWFELDWLCQLDFWISVRQTEEKVKYVYGSRNSNTWQRWARLRVIESGCHPHEIRIQDRHLYNIIAK